MHLGNLADTKTGTLAAYAGLTLTRDSRCPWSPSPQTSAGLPTVSGPSLTGSRGNPGGRVPGCAAAARLRRLAPTGSDRASAWAQAVDHYRRVCEEAAPLGLPIGLQNHNHGGLCGTGANMVRFIEEVHHPNLVVVLDCGQFVGSPGASGVSAGAAGQAELLTSIRQVAPLARHVRVKFYRPRADGSEPGIPYDQIFDILRGVHYPGFLDIVYEPAKSGGEPARTADTADCELSAADELANHTATCRLTTSTCSRPVATKWIQRRIVCPPRKSTEQPVDAVWLFVQDPVRGAFNPLQSRPDRKTPCLPRPDRETGSGPRDPKSRASADGRGDLAVAQVDAASERGTS